MILINLYIFVKEKLASKLQCRGISICIVRDLVTVQPLYGINCYSRLRHNRLLPKRYRPFVRKTGSLPESRRLIFSLWRRKIKHDTMSAHPVIAGERVLIHTATGSTQAPARDPADTRLVIQTIRVKIKQTPITAGGASTRKHPAAVATPFPPFFNRK